MYFGNKPYELEGYIKNHGDGSNMYRGEDFAQPRTIHEGDVLSNGWTVVGDPFAGYNSSVGLRFSNGESRIVAPRIPLQLMSDRSGILPHELRIGHILQTGCVVLDNPKRIGSVDWHDNQDEVEIKLTGGRQGHNVGVPSDLAIAVFGESYPPSSSTALGAFILERTVSMDEDARKYLPKSRQ